MIGYVFWPREISSICVNIPKQRWLELDEIKLTLPGMGNLAFLSEEEQLDAREWTQPGRNHS